VLVDLAGWRLEGGVDFTFPTNTVLGVDAYLILANNAAVLRAKYPGSPFSAISWENCLTGPTASDCATPKATPLTKSPTTTIFPGPPIPTAVVPVSNCATARR